MAADSYEVMGGYAQLTKGGLTLQTEHWRAPHDAVRDPEAVATLAEVGLNATQMKRYFIDGDPMKGTTANEVEYTVQTVYVRAGTRSRSATARA